MVCNAGVSSPATSCLERTFHQRCNKFFSRMNSWKPIFSKVIKAPGLIAPTNVYDINKDIMHDTYNIVTRSLQTQYKCMFVQRLHNWDVVIQDETKWSDEAWYQHQQGEAREGRFRSIKWSGQSLLDYANNWRRLQRRGLERRVPWLIMLRKEIVLMMLSEHDFIIFVPENCWHFDKTIWVKTSTTEKPNSRKYQC